MLQNPLTQTYQLLPIFRANYSLWNFFLRKLLHSEGCRSRYSTVQKAAPKSDVKTNKMKPLSVGEAKPCGTSISKAFIRTDFNPLNKWSWLRWARGKAGTSSSRAKQEDTFQQKEGNAPSLATNSSKLQNSGHGGNEETRNYKAPPEQPPWPQIQLPDGRCASASGPESTHWTWGKIRRSYELSGRASVPRRWLAVQQSRRDTRNVKMETNRADARKPAHHFSLVRYLCSSSN